MHLNKHLVSVVDIQYGLTAKSISSEQFVCYTNTNALDDGLSREQYLGHQLLWILGTVLLVLLWFRFFKIHSTKYLQIYNKVNHYYKEKLQRRRQPKVPLHHTRDVPTNYNVRKYIQIQEWIFYLPLLSKSDNNFIFDNIISKIIIFIKIGYFWDGLFPLLQNTKCCPPRHTHSLFL